MHWTIKEGVADARRVCIIGIDYAGYMALTAAECNPELFRCAASIGGYGDFTLQVPGAMPMGFLMGGAMEPAQDKLRAEAPRQHAAEFKVSVLLVHGDRDAMVTVEQSKAMDAALTAAHRPHQLVIIPGGDHAISAQANRAQMLTALESFLASNLH